MLISVLTGFAAGAVHVVGGADHLVAMAPFSMRRPMQAVKSGMAWGGGHSLGVVLLGVVAIFFKDLIHVESMSAWAEFLVGVSLLVIGALAIRTAFGLELHTHDHHHDGSARCPAPLFIQCVSSHVHIKSAQCECQGFSARFRSTDSASATSGTWQRARPVCRARIRHEPCCIYWLPSIHGCCGST